MTPCCFLLPRCCLPRYRDQNFGTGNLSAGMVNGVWFYSCLKAHLTVRKVSPFARGREVRDSWSFLFPAKCKASDILINSCRKLSLEKTWVRTVLVVYGQVSIYIVLSISDLLTDCTDLISPSWYGCIPPAWIRIPHSWKYHFQHVRNLLLWFLRMLLTISVLWQL